MGAAGSLDHLWRAGSHDAHLFVALRPPPNPPPQFSAIRQVKEHAHGASTALRPALSAF